MRHMTVVTDVMFQDKMAKLPKSRNIQPKRFVMAREIKNRFRTVKRDSLTPTFPEFVNYVVSVDIDNLIKKGFPHLQGCNMGRGWHERREYDEACQYALEACLCQLWAL